MTADTSHDAFPQPANDKAKVWRYMDFAKYVSLLKEQSLYFAKLNTLGDPFEGSLSRDEYEHWIKVAKEVEERGDLPKDWKGRYFDILMANARRARKECYVNCWHFNEVESEAMWKIYSSSEYAIAVSSTYNLLANALPTVYEANEHFGPLLGAVQYADHHQDKLPTGNIFNAIMHKHLSFKHEQECRAVVWRNGGKNWPGPVPDQVIDTYPNGLIVPTDLGVLIQKVIVSPSAPEWFSDAVADITSKYGYKFPVESSSLGLRPYL